MAFLGSKELAPFFKKQMLFDAIRFLIRFSGQPVSAANSLGVNREQSVIVLSFFCRKRYAWLNVVTIGNIRPN